jgi:hypothetical protein
MSFVSRLPPDQWLARFAQRLRQLCPQVGAEEAIDIALDVYHDANDFDPEETAIALCVKGRPPRLPARRA